MGQGHDLDEHTLALWRFDRRNIAKNVLLSTEAFSTAPWTRANNIAGLPVVTPDVANSPVGILNADRIAFPAVSGGTALSLVRQQFTAREAGKLTFSVWLRVESGTGLLVISLGTTSAAGPFTVCNLTTDWQRFAVTWDVVQNGVYITDLGANLNGAGQTAKPAVTVLAWGAQAEFGTAPTAYEVGGLVTGPDWLDETGVHNMTSTGSPRVVPGGIVSGQIALTGTQALTSAALSDAVRMALQGSFTVEGWIMSSTVTAGSFGYLIGALRVDAVAQRLFNFVINRSRVLIIAYANTTGAEVTLSTGITLDMYQRSHVAWRCTVRGDGLTDWAVFVDGAKTFEALGQPGRVTAAVAYRFSISRWESSATSENWNGTLSDFRVSDVPRTDAEILASYEAGVAPPGTPAQDAPTVEDVQPPPGDDLPPEAVVTFKVRDDVGLRRVLVFVRSASTYEVAFDGLNFGPRYADASSRAPLADGWAFELRRRNGWPKGEVSVEVLPVDTAGQFDA